MTTAYTTDARFALHDDSSHPEHAGRLEAISRTLTSSGLAERLLPVTPRPATQDELLAVHAPEHLARIEATRGRARGRLEIDTYVTGHSDEIARLAAGSVLALVDTVLGGEAANGLAAVRPPGHHATPTRAMGFCLLNNVAVAARYAQRQHGLGRVAIVDIDVHHGNGTQDIFYSDPSVLFISTHQSPLYPGTGALGETGAGAGQGTTINVPLPPGVGDKGYHAVMERVITPALRRFAPELLFVSVGFDAHWADPLAQMALSLRGYDALMRQLAALAGELCEGRIVVVLEGGYHLGALANGWANAVRALLGDADCADPLGPAGGGEPEIGGLIDRILNLHHLP
jgi:acetoin utilization deacetylase AcuC-like enzyme